MDLVFPPRESFFCNESASCSDKLSVEIELRVQILGIEKLRI